MKIGVSLSGCAMGGLSAYGALHWLRQEGLSIHMLSACGTPTVPALLFASGIDEQRCQKWLEAFFQDRQEADLDTAIANLAAHIPREHIEKTTGLALSTMRIADGQAVAFTNDFAFQTDTLRTYPLSDAYAALSASVGAVDGLCSFLYRGQRLCDYCVQYGCPLYGLRMTGCDKILSLSFLPEIPGSPYDIQQKSSITSTCGGADLHLGLDFPCGSLSPAEFQNIAISKLESCRNQIIIALAA